MGVAEKPENGYVVTAESVLVDRKVAWEAILGVRRRAS